MNKKVEHATESERAARAQSADLTVENQALKSLLQQREASLADKDRLLQEHLAARVSAEREAKVLADQRHWLLSTGVPQLCTIVFLFILLFVSFQLSKCFSLARAAC